MYHIFQLYLSTSPRSIREAVRLAHGEDAEKPVSIPGNVFRCAQRWNWQGRAQKFDEHEAARQHALDEAARARGRARRRARLEKVGALFDARIDGLSFTEMEPHRVVQELVRFHNDEREELLDRPEDRKGEDRQDGGLPSIDDVIREPKD